VAGRVVGQDAYNCDSVPFVPYVPRGSPASVQACCWSAPGAAVMLSASVSASRGIAVCMEWTVVYRRSDGEHVTEFASSEAAARQNFAKWVKAAPTEGYTFVRLVRDGVVVGSWPDAVGADE
jgi:hypothetical protein